MRLWLYNLSLFIPPFSTHLFSVVPHVFAFITQITSLPKILSALFCHCLGAYFLVLSGLSLFHCCSVTEMCGRLSQLSVCKHMSCICYSIIQYYSAMLESVVQFIFFPAYFMDNVSIYLADFCPAGCCGIKVKKRRRCVCRNYWSLFSSKKFPK